MIEESMRDRTEGDLQEVFSQFAVEGEFIRAVPYGTGHINDTYVGEFNTRTTTKRYVLQSINHKVFQEPEKVMENIQRVTQYARQQIIARNGDPDRETLNLVPTRSGKWFLCTTEGVYWRMYQFIPGASTYDIAQNLEQVYHAAKAFGNFQKLLDSLPGPRLHETIPNFHHTGKRFAWFLEVLARDPVNRAATVKAEIDFILKRGEDATRVIDLLAQRTLPERVTHNDTKLNNVMLDDQTGEGICVIDLDTMMPGSILYDFGDLIRMGTATAAEDEPNLDKVGLELRLFELLTRGYLDATRDFLTSLELDLLVFSGRLITYEQAIRFLGDYINGDTYYKTQREGHNLDRARTQIKMLAEMERQQDAMEKIVELYRRA